MSQGGGKYVWPGAECEELIAGQIMLCTFCYVAGLTTWKMDGAWVFVTGCVYLGK